MTHTKVPSRGAAPDDLFVWRRDPHRQWSDMLQRMRPMTDKSTGLVIAWEPGDLWEPVQRWFIYALFPKHAIDSTIREQLEGPDPRSKGHACFGTNAYGMWCSCLAPKNRWVDGPAPLITRQAWLLYRQYGGWIRPLWVVQGDKGGHKYRFTHWESTLSRLAGGPPQPPAAGDLPYAEPDERTWEHLHYYADPYLLHKYRELVKFGMRNPGDLDPTSKEAAEFAAIEVLKSLGLGVAEHADEFRWALKKDNANTALIDTPRDDADAGIEQVKQDITDTFRESL